MVALSEWCTVDRQGCIHCQEWPHAVKLSPITHALLSLSHPSLTPTWRLPRPRKVVHIPWCTGPKWLRRTSIQGKDVVHTYAAVATANMSRVVIVRKGWPVYWSIGRLLTSLYFHNGSEYQCWYWAKLLKLCLFIYICTYITYIGDMHAVYRCTYMNIWDVHAVYRCIYMSMSVLVVGGAWSGIACLPVWFQVEGIHPPHSEALRWGLGQNSEVHSLWLEYVSIYVLENVF